jgi:hypothetical protein
VTIIGDILVRGWGGHINGHNVDKIIEICKEIGFSNGTESQFCQSFSEELRLNKLIDLDIRKNESFYVEFVK